jgi:F-type H+-transporting ATPase subunit gamma
MANPRALLKRRKAIQNTRKITRTMELVSTARLSRTQGAAIAARPYANKLREVIRSLSELSPGLTHPLFETHEPARKAVVLLLTSDRGLCGAFNSNILRHFRAFHEELRQRGLDIELHVQGRKGLAACKHWGLPVAQSYLNVADKPTYARAEEIAGRLMERFLRREIDEAHLVYSSFRSMIAQIPRSDRLLPLAGPDLPSGGAPGGGPSRPASRAPVGMGFLFHPDPERLLRELLPLVAKVSLYSALLDNCAGEQAARRVAMKNATDAADKITKFLTQAYNRARQYKITGEISEIVSGVEAL